MKTGKSRKKYDTTKALVIKQLAEAFQVSGSYIRMALRGDRDNETTLAIKKEYNRLYKAINLMFLNKEI